MLREKECLTILVADDDADDREFVMIALKAANIVHKFIEAKDGHQLLHLLENRGQNHINEEEPDLVILDLNMPKVDGFAALEHIKKSLNLKDIPVYVLSTSGDKVHMEKAINLGASGYYRKSASFKDLVSMVSEVCERHHKL